MQTALRFLIRDIASAAVSTSLKSSATQAAIIAALPTPPRQCITTMRPVSRRSEISSTSANAADRSSGAAPSMIGNWISRIEYLRRVSLYRGIRSARISASHSRQTASVTPNADHECTSASISPRQGFPRSVCNVNTARVDQTEVQIDHQNANLLARRETEQQRARGDLRQTVHGQARARARGGVGLLAAYPIGWSNNCRNAHGGRRARQQRGCGTAPEHRFLSNSRFEQPVVWEYCTSVDGD